MNLLTKILLLGTKIIFVSCSAGGTTVGIVKVLFLTNSFKELFSQNVPLANIGIDFAFKLFENKKPNIITWTDIKPSSHLPLNRVDVLGKKFANERWEECLTQCNNDETLAESLFQQNIILSQKWAEMLLSELKTEQINNIDIIQYLKHYPYSCIKSLLIDLISQFLND